MVKVKIYTTTTCPYCKMEKQYLDEKGISYENFFVDQDPKAAEEMLSISHHGGVPFTVISKEDGTQESILGFDKARIDQILNL